MSRSNLPPLRLDLRSTASFSVAEVSGAFGDLATLAPLLVALVTLNHLNPTGVFLVVGLAYVLNGLYYGLPVPVQPLKAASATAIALGLSASVVSGAGWLMGFVLLALAATRLIEPLRRLFARPIVRGIQLSLGLLLVRSAWRLISGPSLFSGVSELPTAWSPSTVHLALVGGAAALLLVGLLWRRLPTALLVLGFGLGAAVVLGIPSVAGELRWGFRPPALVWPSLSDFASAALLLVVPQLPLTLGNAVVATADTAERYFGPQARRVQPKALLTTMGVSNLLAGLLGGMPICHGSGGLTAHVRFGARSGAAPLLIGGLCLATALLLDGGVLPLLALFPLPVLGVLLLYVGVQHGLLAADLRRPADWAVAVGIAVVSLAASNLALGFGVGAAAYWLPRVSVSLKRRVDHALAQASLTE